MSALCILIARKLRHVYFLDIPIFATFGRQLKCLLVRIQVGLYLFHYVLDNLNRLLLVFLSNLIINLMYNIKKLYFNDQHKSEFKNDFDKESLKRYYSSHSKHSYLIEKTCRNEVCITSAVKHRHPVYLPTFLDCSKTGMFVIYHKFTMRFLEVVL